MQALIIFPYNGNAFEAVDALGEEFTLVGFVDDDIKKHGMSKFGVPIAGREFLERHSEAKILAVPGSTSNYLNRHEIISELGITLERSVTVIHPSASVSRYSNIGRNCLIMSGVCISANAAIGDNVCVLPNAVIHHDSVIGDNTLIGAGVIVAGHSHVGDNCYLGSGTTVRDNIRIGNRNLIGMSSNVVKDLGSNATVFGNPAQISKRDNP